MGALGRIKAGLGAALAGSERVSGSDRVRRDRQLEKALKHGRRQGKQIARLGAELERMHEILRRMLKRSAHVERNIEALVRHAFLGIQDLPYPHALTAARFHLGSQHDEDGITYRLLSLAGISNSRFVELGSGMRGGNSAFLAEELGWSGLMVDGDPGKIARVQRRYGSRVAGVASFVTPDNVDDLLRGHGFEGEYGTLSIDLDGTDYWVWEAMTVGNPAIVIVEYNGMFGPTRSVVVPYQNRDIEPGSHDEGDRPWLRYFFGASLAALTRLAARKGYRLVAAEPRGVNAYFLRSDVAPEVPAATAGRAFHLAESASIFLATQREDFFQAQERMGLPLDEVD